MLDQALFGIVHGMRINSWAMQRIVGHITHQMLVRRPLLAALRSVYSFINADILDDVPVWPSVRDELRAIRGLMVFAESRMGTPFATAVQCTDACLLGYGIMERTLPVAQIKCICSHDERWRFLENSTGKDHRAAALGPDFGADPLVDLRTVKSDVSPVRELHETADFPNVHRELLNFSDWRFVMATQLRVKEPVHMCELVASYLR